MDKLIWVSTKPDLWRSVCGQWVIVRVVLPDDRPEHDDTYLLRRLDPAGSAAWPGWLGYPVSEHPALHYAQDEAERRAWSLAQGAACNVPEDLPSEALARFFWPVSEGTSQGALAIVRDGDRLLARVVGMTRGDNDTYEPGTYAELDLTPLLTGGQLTSPPRGCPDCQATVNAEHDQHCDVARCLHTGQQRLMCQRSDDTPATVEIDGEIVHGTIRDGHDCGRDVWTGRWPGQAECEEFGWWAQDRCAEGLGFVPCAPDAPGAHPDLNRLVTEAVWNPTTRRWDRRTQDAIGR